MKKTQLFSLTVALWFAGCAHHHASLGPVVRTETFQGVQDLRFDLVHFSEIGGSGLVRITRSGTPMDGHVFAFETEVTDRWTSYSVPYDGGRWQVLLTTARSTTGFTPAGRDLPLKLGATPVPPHDAEAMIAMHLEEERTGVLAKLAAFDRAGAIADQKEKLGTGLEKVRETCGLALTDLIDFDALSDDYLRNSAGLGALCNDVLGAMAQMCAAPAGREVIREQVKQVRCLAGDLDAPSTRPSLYAIEGGVLRYTSHYTGNTVEKSRLFFSELGGSPTASASAFPWRDGSSVRDRVILDAMSVCADEQGHVIVVGPRITEVGMLDDQPRISLFTGTSAGLYPVTRAPEDERTWLYDLDPVSFVDPRQHGSTPETKFRSRLVTDFAKKECTLSCGARVVKVPMRSREEGRKLVLSAKAISSPFTRKPHALLRDPSGTYYFVDSGAQPEREKDFRVFVGPRGQMKQLKMTNSLSDSEGEVFSTKGGDLRLVLDRLKPSSWTLGKKRVELRAVPVDENLDVIFVDLGIYAGQRLGTPCDDF